MTSPVEAPRVTTLELFFDLVFVFTLTQLTTVLFRAPNARGLLQVVLMLGVIWWMYGGYAWLTNAVSAHTLPRRLLLFAAMGAYFVLALAIPTAFEGTGLAFGLAYLLVVVIHIALFTRTAAVSAARAILMLAPYNLSGALVVLAGGAIGGTTQYVLWGATGVAFEWLTPLIRGTSGFLIEPAHFVERHGLVVIIAIGESVVAIGFGASQLTLDAQLVAVALVGLALSACLWWLYFGGDDERAEHALLRSAAATTGAGRSSRVRLLAHPDAARDHRDCRRRTRGDRASVFLAELGEGDDSRGWRRVRTSQETSPFDPSSRSDASAGARLRRC